MFGKPWLKRNYKEKQFGLSVNYIIQHLDPLFKERVLSQDSWQTTKTQRVVDAISKDPQYILKNPPCLVLHASKELFRMDDGVSRLRACKQKHITQILVHIRIGDW